MNEEQYNKAEERQQQITQGSLRRSFFVLAGPAIATMSAEFILHFTDMIWVGRLGGPVPVAVVTSSMFALWIVWSLVSVLTVGTVAVVSRHFGAREYDKSSYVSTQSVIYGLFVGLIIAILGVALTPLAFRAMDSSPQVSAGGIVYLRILLGASVLFIFINVMGSIFRATGDTKTPMIITLIEISINIVLDPIFIFGWGPIPRMGTTGAAIASIIAITFACAAYVIFLMKDRLSIGLNPLKSKKIDFKLAWRIIKIGLPLSIAGILFSLVYFIINRVATQFGDNTVAAMGIGNRCESISYLLCFGASMATSTMVGQNLGANNPARAEKSGWIALFYTGIFTLFITGLFLTIPEQITRIFISDATVEPIVKNYLLIIGLSQVFMASEIVLEGAFSGAGDTLPPTIIGIFWSLLRIPLAYLLCFQFDMGSNGIWIAISSTGIIKGIIMAIWWKRGKWKLKQV